MGKMEVTFSAEIYRGFADRPFSDFQFFLMQHEKDGKRLLGWLVEDDHLECFFSREVEIGDDGESRKEPETNTTRVHLQYPLRSDLQEIAPNVTILGIGDFLHETLEVGQPIEVLQVGDAEPAFSGEITFTKIVRAKHILPEDLYQSVWGVGGIPAGMTFEDHLALLDRMHKDKPEYHGLDTITSVIGVSIEKFF